MNYYNSNLTERQNEKLKPIFDFFEKATTPTEPIRINACTVVSDLPRFVDSHLFILKNCKVNKTFILCFERLELVMDKLKHKKKGLI
jgi:hypothetical protein